MQAVEVFSLMITVILDIGSTRQEIAFLKS